MKHKYFEVNEKGLNVRCKVYFTDKAVAERAVLYCTGFGGHKDNNATARFAEKLLSKHKDMLVLVFNWPAHGDDVKKKLTLEDCDTYLELVIQEAKTVFGVRQLYAYATSFGGYLVLKYISEHGSEHGSGHSPDHDSDYGSDHGSDFVSDHGNPFEKIALRCPAIDMFGVLRRSIVLDDEYDRLMKGKEVLVGFDRKVLVTPAFLESVRENDIRQREFLDFADDILILHGTKDEIAPFEESEAFAEENVIEFIPIEGADHRFQNLSHMSLANKYVMEFFDS